MASTHQFAYGWVTPALAYLLSLVGCLLGLVATVRARSASARALRARWLVLAAFAIGGTGIWAMHFLAMIGFSVDGTPVRFDIPATVASWLTAVVVVGIGLFIVGFGRPSIVKVIPAGILTGAGVAAMHYSGMAAVRVNGTLSYDRRYVIAAIAIAIVAATVALWFTVAVQRPVALLGSAALMAVAVSGMHYTGMFGLRVHVHDGVAEVPGAQALSFLIPILAQVLVVIVALFYSLLAQPSQADRDVQAELRARIASMNPETRPAAYIPTFGATADAQAGAGQRRQPPPQQRRTGQPGFGAPDRPADQGGYHTPAGARGGFGAPAGWEPRPAPVRPEPDRAWEPWGRPGDAP